MYILTLRRDKTGQYEYEMAFDINMKDVTGQSALYLACYVGNQKLVDLLLKHKVQGTRAKVSIYYLPGEFIVILGCKKDILGSVYLQQVNTDPEL